MDNETTITTTINVDSGNGAHWGSTSSTATIDDPCRDHTGDYPDGVYDELEDAWEDLGDDDEATVSITKNGVTYTLSAD